MRVIYRTLFVSGSGLDNAKKVVAEYKQGKTKDMTPDLWQAKKIVDSTLHPGMDHDCLEDMGSEDLSVLMWVQTPASLSSSHFACPASSFPTSSLPPAC